MKLKQKNEILPREKLLKYNNPDKLKTEELLEMILRTGTKNFDVLTLAKKILKHYDRELPYVSVKELKNFLNIGETRACSIVAHNHPFGFLEPSKDELEITQRLVKSGEILGIELLDHVIVSKNGYFSFKEHKLI
jgi:DNA repair protein RadC